MRFCRLQSAAALHYLAQLQALMDLRFSPDMAVDLSALRNMLDCLKSVLPASPVEVAATTSGNDDGTQVPVPLPRQLTRGVHSVDSRQDAIRAIELVCTYLERNEPTNPAQFLLRRAARVIDRNFLQLVRELAPDAVKEVARIMGVDPSTITDQN